MTVRADTCDVKVRRVVLEVGGGAYTLPLHPRLTIISGVGPAERALLATELVGGLTGSRRGIRVEVVDDTGRRLTVFRPAAGPDRVLDAATGVDVTEELADESGRVDLLTRAGLEGGEDCPLRVGPRDLTAPAATSGVAPIDALAAIDPEALWPAAENVLETEAAVTRAAGETAESPAMVDAAVLEDIERRHLRLEHCIERHERAGFRQVLLAAMGLVAAIAAAFLAPRVAPFLGAVPALAALWWLAGRRAVKRAAKAERNALTAVGAQSYLGFHLERVEAMLADSEQRARLVKAVDAHNEAVAAWRELAGTIEVAWALAHRDEIEAAAKARRPLVLDVTAGDAGSDTVADLLNRFESRLRLAGRSSRAAGALPVVLDDPFRDLGPATKPALLELVGRVAGDPQIVFLTDDPDVASWGHVEALTGDVSVIDANPGTTSPAPAAGGLLDLRHLAS